MKPVSQHENIKIIIILRIIQKPMKVLVLIVVAIIVFTRVSRKRNLLSSK
jgi:hypothetical protein